MRYKCSVCRKNWEDCIHAEFDDVYGHRRRQWIIGIMVTVAAVLIIGGVAVGMMA